MNRPAKPGTPGSTLIVIAKEPRPGRVKTRLTPAFTPDEAAQLARAALRDTLEVIAATPAVRRILLLDGSPGTWMPDGFEVVPQVAGGLDLRLAHAFSLGRGPTLLVGMDTPQLQPAHLLVDFTAHDAWIGHTPDGGFWAVGMHEPDPGVFPGVPMSTADTGRIQEQRLVSAGHSVGQLIRLRDVDTAADATVVAESAPNTRFALEHDGIRSTNGWPGTDVLATALNDGGAWHLEAPEGVRIPLPVERWRSAPDHADRSLLERCEGRTLDVGCGPGRFTIALTRRGQACLGVDSAPSAVRLTRAGGATAHCQSIFDPLPYEGDWDTVLLADGNLGIAGNPDRLLQRAHELLRPGGRLLLEPVASEADEVLPVTLTNGQITGPRFLWAQVGPSAAHRRASGLGFAPEHSWQVADRCFLSFRR